MSLVSPVEIFREEPNHFPTKLLGGLWGWVGGTVLIPGNGLFFYRYLQQAACMMLSAWYHGATMSNDNSKHTITLRVSKETAQRWHDAAKRERRSVNGMIEVWMTQHPGLKDETLHRDAEGNLVESDSKASY